MNRFSVLTILGLLAVLVFGAVPQTAQAQGVVWNTEFYNNAYLMPPAVVTRQDSAVSFNWGSGSPAAGVNADNFTARFSTSLNFAAGTYRFYVQADDGVHLIIDNNTILINTFDQPRVGELLTVDVPLSAGTHNIQLDYRENGGLAYVYLNWANLATNPTGPNFPSPGGSPSSPPTTGGNWTAQYFSNTNLSGTPFAILNEISPSHNWASGAPLNGMPADNFSVRYSSAPSLDGSYRITVRADDGVRVYVNGQLLINEWHGATGQTYTADFTVGRGVHAITIDYYEAGGVAFLDYGLQAIGGSSVRPVQPTQPPVASGAWTAQYYPNTSLSGTPFAIISENSPVHFWGRSAPLTGMPAEGFSVRWTSTQNLAGGNYRIDVRADDGVRVYVDNTLRINEWHTSAGTQIYTVTLSLTAGNHSFTIEYYDESLDALLDYALVPLNGAPQQPQQPPATGGAYGSITVTTGLLNVRSAPDVTNGLILTKIPRGATYNIVGRNADSTWWQIDVNGRAGWVSGFYVNAVVSGSVPVTSSGTVPPPAAATGYSLVTRANLNVRAGAGTQFPVMTVISRGRSAQILGRNSNSTWWQVNYEGTVGWVHGGFVTLPTNIDLNSVPVR